MSTVAIITGPTATGKSKLGALLARDFNGEVVSADSMQVYREMDIGTAKPSRKDTLGITHHMLDVESAFENYSVARYVTEASACADSIIKRGKLPFIVGGTGLYIDSLVSGRRFDSNPGDKDLRCELGQLYDKLGGAFMLSELARVDPERAMALAVGDKRRITRALEIFLIDGKTFTQLSAESKMLPPRYRSVTIILNFKSRQELYRRINARVDDMLSNGLVAEVERLLSHGLDRGKTAMQAIGYKEIARALGGEISLEEAVELTKRESTRYAKRQLTWLRSKKDALWIEWDSEPDFDYARQISTEFLHASGIK